MSSRTGTLSLKRDAARFSISTPGPFDFNGRIGLRLQDLRMPERHYLRFNENELLGLGERYGASHVVFRTRRELGLPRLYSNDNWVVYRLE